eukprot:682205-Prorocentrum_minimum.AAC.2
MWGDLSVKSRRRVKPRNRDDKAKNTRGVFRVRCAVHEGHKRGGGGSGGIVRRRDCPLPEPHPFSSGGRGATPCAWPLARCPLP